MRDVVVAPAELVRGPGGDARFKPDEVWLPSLEAGVERKSKLVLLIHGWRGSADTSWLAFPALLRDDPAINQTYDVAAFSYHTALWAISGASDIATIAQGLKTELDHKFDSYQEIVILAHSMGGLVTRSYLANERRNRRPTKVSRVVTFATPHRGALAPALAGAAAAAASAAISATSTALAALTSGITGIAGNLAGQVASGVVGLGVSRQTMELAYDSSFLQDLELIEAGNLTALGSDPIAWTYVVGEKDAFVGKSSAWGQGLPVGFELVLGADHHSIVTPASHDDTSYRIAARALSRTDLPKPWTRQADHSQPNLRQLEADVDPARRKERRLTFWNEAVPFYGRDGETATIEAMLDAADAGASAIQGRAAFRWMLMSGAGRTGKSRLALEMVRRLEHQPWNAGFLDRGDNEAPNWSRWQPMLPTFIVIDYAGRDPEAVAAMLAGLANREAAHVLSYPVRVLLIERDDKGPWLDTLLKDDRVRDDTRLNGIALPPIDDPWPIFEAVLGKDAAARQGREPTLELLARIDKERRPLYAFMLAIALEDGVTVASREDLLTRVITRDRDKFWHAQLPPDPLPVPASLPEQRALALATMMIGLPAVVLDGSHGDLLPKWHMDRHPLLFRAMTGGDAGDGIRPLEPDIVGEFFVLELLRGLPADAVRTLVERAWATRPERMWWFVSRCANDFLDHPQMLATFSIKPSTPVIAGEWAKAANNLVLHLGPTRPVEALAIYEALKALATSAPAPEINVELAKAAFNLVFDFRPTRPEQALAIYEELKALAKSAPAPEINEWLAKAAYNLVTNFGPTRPDEALAIYGELKALATSAPAPAPEINVELAKAAFNLVIHLGPTRPVEALAIYEELKALAKSAPAPEINEWLARTGFHAVPAAALSGDVARGRALLLAFEQAAVGDVVRSAGTLIAAVPLLARARGGDGETSVALDRHLRERVAALPDAPVVIGQIGQSFVAVAEASGEAFGDVVRVVRAMAALIVVAELRGAAEVAQLREQLAAEGGDDVRAAAILLLADTALGRPDEARGHLARAAGGDAERRAEVLRFAELTGHPWFEEGA